MCRHTEKERAAAAEQSHLQADLEGLRTEAAARARQLQGLEDRASSGDAAVAEAHTLRQEAANSTAARIETERKLKESECALQQARDELKMLHDKVLNSLIRSWATPFWCQFVEQRTCFSSRA